MLNPPGLTLVEVRYAGKLPDEGDTVRIGMSDGPDGIFDVTLPVAAQLARKYSGDPRIIHLARTIVHACPDEDRACSIVKIHDYVSKRCRYQDDPEGMRWNKEFIYTPLRALSIAAERGHFRGDCEEIACLAATLLEAAGVPCGFAVGQRTREDGVLYHVWVIATADYNGQRWIHIDPTHHLPPGRTAGRFEKYFFLPI